LSFIVPLSLPSVIHFSVSGGYYGLMSSAAIAIYGLIIFSLLKSSFTSFKKSTTLNYQLQKEIDKRSLVEKQLQEISRRDSLTGMFNRRYFDEMLSVEIGRASRNHSPLCLLMFDVDCFKEYNDKYGHVAGDNCLIKIAEIVEKLTSRKGDLIARYGGEEFAVILPNIELTGAVAFAKKLQEGVQKHKIEHLSSKLTTLKCVTISVGVTHLMPFTKMTANQIIEAADNALYEAKRDGRNRVHHHQNRSFDAGLS
jgi:diguanylate cyclase (GGDEF)-like protein